MRVLVIGGGAAGFFSAISCARNNPEAEISLLEKSHKLLSKVKISGGGRCNVTHAAFENYQLIRNYPRGANELKKMFMQFSVKDTLSFFQSRGVSIKEEKDGRMFPVSDNSQTIVDCLIKEARVMGVKIMTEFAVKSIEKNEGSFSVKLRSGESLITERIIVATGGNPNDDSYHWLRELGHTIVPPVPSLFTFNIPNSRYNGLQGIAVKDAIVKIAGEDLEQRGPLLITHWGFSGPAILKLSAWAARVLHARAYNFNISINWVPEHSEVSLRLFFTEYKDNHPKKFIFSNPCFDIPKRLWERMCMLSGIEEELKWSELPNKFLNRLIEELFRGNFVINGKTTFKEEFVTCGGINLADVDISTLQSKKCSGIFFAGEVLDIDGITGGFNFQAAWTTGWIAGKAAGSFDQ